METQLSKDKEKKSYKIFHLFTESSLGWRLQKRIVLQLVAVNNGTQILQLC